MIEAKVNLSGALGPTFFRRLAADIDEKVGAKMTYWGNRKLSQYTTSEKKEPTSISVDGLPATRNDFVHARKTIQIIFIRRLISIVVDELNMAVRAAVRERGPKARSAGQWTNVPQIEESVIVFYGGADKPIHQVQVKEITEFNPGDVVLVVPTFGLQVYANAQKYRGSGPGIMALAARKIRSILKLRNKSSALRVSAQRSRAAFYKMLSEPPPIRYHREAKRRSPVEMTTPWPGSDSLWVIAIRYSKNYKGSL